MNQTGSGTFGADEAPADVDVFVVLDAAARREMVWADDAVVGEHYAARRHAQVIGMIGHRAANASDQTTCSNKRADVRKMRHGVIFMESSTRLLISLPLEMVELLGLAMKQVRQTWIEQRKPRFTGAVGAKVAMHSPW